MIKWLRQLFCAHFWVIDATTKPKPPLAYEYIMGKGQYEPYICIHCDKQKCFFDLPINYLGK